MPTFPAPPAINGDILTAELAAALAVDADAVDVFLRGDEVVVTVPEDADEAAVEAAVAAHDPEVFHEAGPTLPADGATPATVRWQRRSAAGTDVPYDVNGAGGNARADADGVVELAVTAAQPGPVRVQVGTLSVTLTAEEV